MGLTKKNGFTHGLHSMTRKFIQSPIIEKLLYIICLFIVINIILNYFTPVQEGFTEKRELVIKRGRNIYDDFYVGMYDDLFYNKIKNDFEIGTIQNTVGPTEASIILDIGSGTGHHVKAFTDNNIKAIGMDTSQAMISKAEANYPGLEFRKEDALNREAFAPSTFTHITCFNFTVYYFQNKEKFFQNCYYWLKPGGYIILHLVDKNRFDPILPAGDPFVLVPQKYVVKKEKNTYIKFVGYDYKSNFEVYPNDSTAVLHERIKDVKSGKVRKQELFLYMPTQKRILNVAKNTGFLLLGQIDMSEVQYKSQYLYILQKPN